MKKMNNNGFSLVELIIVIAIMAVLIGVMAPQFLKYVEQSRKSTDISNAQSIATAIQADIADGYITTNATGQVVTGSTTKSITEKPLVRGTVGAVVTPGSDFTYDCNVATGVVKVYVGGGAYELYPGTDSAKGADVYKKAK